MNSIAGLGMLVAVTKTNRMMATPHQPDYGRNDRPKLPIDSWAIFGHAAEISNSKAAQLEDAGRSDKFPEVAGTPAVPVEFGRGK